MSKWIAITDRLPPERTPVLVWVATNDEWTMAQFYGEHDDDPWGLRARYGVIGDPLGARSQRYRVSHWMPGPDQPTPPTPRR